MVGTLLRSHPEYRFFCEDHFVRFGAAGEASGFFAENIVCNSDGIFESHSPESAD